MSAVITANERLARDNRAPAPVLKDNGENYPWRMFYNDNQLIADMDYTDEALELLAPGYTALSQEEKLAERIILAQNVQLFARSTVLAGLDDEAAGKLAEWELAVLTYQGETNNDPYGWGAGSGTLGVKNDEEVDLWSSDVQLVLLDTSYAPHTDIIRPMSIEGDYTEVKNIIWLRPESELSLLRSLSNIGFITFGTPQVEDVYA